jgi:hypothetical protein
MSNTALWEKVCTTDPNHTKEFNRGGGFKGTAINPTYQNLKATEVFGPVGMGWGWRIDKEDYIPGAIIQIKEGQQVQEINHVLRVTVWYLVTPKFVELMPEAEPFLGQKCEVTHFGQTTFVGTNKYGPFTDEEAPKKSLTDGISKCLSCLGFSADIHMGLYDSNKYVNDRKKEFGTEKQATPKVPAEPPAPKKVAVWNDTIKEFVTKHLETEVTTEDQAREFWKSVSADTGITPDDLVYYTELKGLFNARVSQIRAAKT